MGVQASGSEGHPPGLPRDSPAQRQEPTWSALIQGDVFVLNQSYVLSCVGKNDSLLIKATGEPALLMGISVLFSIWDALNSSRFGFADFAV